MGRGYGVKAGSGALFAALLAALLITALAIGQPRAPRKIVDVPPAGSVAFDGSINELASFRHQVFARGRFNHVGTLVGSGVGIDPSTGARATAGFPLTGGQISDILGDGAGGWFIAGSFGTVDGVVQPTVAHVLTDGSLDDGFRPSPIGGDADALALVGDRLFVGGADFTVGNGSTNLIALDPATGQTLPFQSQAGPRVTELAYAPAAPGRTERLFVGTGSGGYSHPMGVTALDPVTGAEIPGFNPPGGGTIRALAVGPDRLYVGGRGLVALDLGTGGRIDSFDPGTEDVFGAASNGVVHVLALDGDRLLAGGSFLSLGGVRGPLVALDPQSGEADPSFAPSLVPRSVDSLRDTGVFDLAVTPDAVWVGGLLAGPTREPRTLVAVDPDSGTTLDRSPPQLNAQANALAYADGRLYVGGWFVLEDYKRANGLALLDASTLAADPDVTGAPPGGRSRRFRAEMLPGRDRLLFAQTNFGGYRHPLGRPWRSHTFRVTAFDTERGVPLPQYRLDRVSDLTGIAIGGKHVYVARRLSDDVRFPRNRISVRSLDSGREVDHFRLPLRGYVTNLDFSDGALYASGSFRRFRADGEPAHLAAIRVDPANGSLDSSFDPHVNGPVYDIDVGDRRAYLAGLFVKAGPRIPPSSTGPTRNPLERYGLEAAQVASGLPVPSFEPQGHYVSDRYRVDAVGAGCIFFQLPYTIYFGTLLSEADGGRCGAAGAGVEPSKATAAAGRLAYAEVQQGGNFGPRWQDSFSYIALAGTPAP